MATSLLGYVLVSVFTLKSWGMAAAIPFDTVLTQADIGSFSDIAFAGVVDNSSNPQISECRSFPGDDDWPTETTWSQFNTSIDGGLLKPVPPAAVCYDGPYRDATKCSTLVRSASSTHFYLDHPLAVLTEWPQGSTCVASLNPSGNCTQGGFPSYVVNVSTIKQVQAAVNFARNRNIRLVIK